MGEAFPADNPVAVFLVALSTALNDLLTTSKWMVGGDPDQPHTNDVTDMEQLYLLRLSFAQLHEVRESVKQARKDEAVEAFLADLPDDAQADLGRLMTVNPREEHWIRQAMEYVRNTTLHYGGKWNWDDQRWAMKQVADDDGVIEMVNEKLVGMRLKFADHVSNRHLTRKFPEYVDDPDAELDNETIEARIGSLFKAMVLVTTSAQNFATAAVSAYLDGLPDGVVRVET
ncbi:MAG: hypothetical protein GY798_17220 [Hyphomicrobiales bacterium]|nr:hypothetical protein [Hyphomicrobiales bacterium]